MRLKLLLAMVLFLGCYSAPGSAQGCAMCKDGVANTSAQMQRGFRRGILMLLLPAAGAMIAFGAIIVKNRKAPE